MFYEQSVTVDGGNTWLKRTSSRLRQPPNPEQCSNHLVHFSVDPLHSPDAYAEAGSQLAETGSLLFFQGGPQSALNLFGNLGAAKNLAVSAGTRKSSVNTFLRHRPFELCKDTKHLKHGFATGRRRIEALLMQE